MRHAPAQFRGGRRGFTLIEVLIVVVILGILAAIVIPQVSGASHTARENTLKDDLRYMRTQILVYKAQHRDVAPGYPGGRTSVAPQAEAFIAQMTRYSDEQGNTSGSWSDRYRFGPYLTIVPTNPITGQDSIKMATGSAALSPDGQSGWLFNPETLEIIANIRDEEEGRGGDGTPYWKY